MIQTNILRSRFYPSHPPYTSEFLVKMSTTTSTSDKTLMEYISEKCSLALSQTITLEPSQGGGASGGGGTTTFAVKDTISGTKYFVKTASVSSGGGTMLYGEFTGVQEMADTSTIRVPRPITFAEYKNPSSNKGGGIAFIVFEYFEFTYGGDEFELGKQLAKVRWGPSIV